MSAVNFPAADSQLELALIEFRATVEILCAEDLLVPLAGTLLVADLDIDMLDHRYPGHHVPPVDLT